MVGTTHHTDDPFAAAAPAANEPKKPTRPRIHPAISNLRIISYMPRLLHLLMGTTSHGTMAHMASIIEQEKLRADPRFPLMQMVQRNKRYKAIFDGTPYQDIFACSG